MTLSGHAGAIPDIAYSPDGSKLATGSGDGTVIIWDTSTGAKVLTLTGHSSQIQAVSFSPDGQLLATGSEDNTAKIWDVATGQEVLSLPGSAGGVAGVAFGPWMVAHVWWLPAMTAWCECFSCTSKTCWRWPTRVFPVR